MGNTFHCQKKHHILIFGTTNHIGQIWYIGRKKEVVYGYCRISTPKQNIERQVRNIVAAFPEAKIVCEVYTGTKFQNRKEFEKLLKRLKPGDTLVFDSVSRMSRNAEEGVEMYFKLVDMGIMLVFIKERYIDSEVYLSSLKDKIELQGTDEDEIFKGLNNYFRKLAIKQIQIAFDQSEKEVKDLRQRTKEGLVTARLNGKQIGTPKGSKFNTKKSIESKKQIQKLSRNFQGSNTDKEVIAILGISKNSYYKYKKELAR